MNAINEIFKTAEMENCITIGSVRFTNSNPRLFNAYVGSYTVQSIIVPAS